MNWDRQIKANASQRGFTLVEMSIVLVIIGLILGAVSIGKDLQRDAEYAKIKQKFVDQWVQAYNVYFQRAGVVIGDDQTKPRFMVNGANYTAASTLPISGGNMTSITGPAQICEPAGTTSPSLHAFMDQLGVRMPPGRAEGSEDRYLYLDSNGNPQEVQVCFQWNAPETASGSGNMMVLKGLTPDLARALDQMIDGKADAREGVFRQEGVANGTPGAAGIQWAGNNTTAFGASTSDNQDEDQVMIVTAHYKMNQ